MRCSSSSRPRAARFMLLSAPLSSSISVFFVSKGQPPSGGAIGSTTNFHSVADVVATP